MARPQSVPVISVVKGVRQTAVQIFAYTIACVAACLLLPVFGYVGVTYTIVMGGLGLYWIWLGSIGPRTLDVSTWAYRMFRFSLMMILALCLMITIGPIIPSHISERFCRARHKRGARASNAVRSQGDPP